MSCRSIILALLLPVLFSVMAFSGHDGSNLGNSKNNNSTCVQFRIKNVKTTRGQFWLAFYKEPGTFPKKGREAFSRLIKLLGGGRKQETTTVCGLEQGWYAVAAFQDLDENGEMTFNIIGLPAEPYGFSNAVHPVLSAPSFQQCRFYIEPGKQPVIDIDLINP